MSTEFEAVAENADLKEAIVGRIQSEGLIPFREFMEAALYHPQHGYYRSRREKMGRQGDYLTSPEVSPIFGVLVGRQLREMWQTMGQPRRFDVVEQGAGTGLLARDILRWAHLHAKPFADTISYTIVEESAVQADRQRETLAEEVSAVRWSGEVPVGTEGCLLSNELLDSFPVHRVAVLDGELFEVFVGWDRVRFVEELRPPSTPEIEAYFSQLGVMPGEGCRAEVNLAAVDWMHQVGGAIRLGFVLTFDYGYEAEDLYAHWRTGGTLMCFHRHNPSNDPYSRVGRQDMTSHLDFTSLRRAGEEAGLTTLGLVPQSEFLSRLGIAEAGLPPAGAGGEKEVEEYYLRRRAISELIDPAALGRIRVLVQVKGVDDPRLTGLERANGG